jgi:hypothetical protein
MIASIRQHRSLAILAVIALLWMGVDWGHNGCDPTPDIVSVR